MLGFLDDRLGRTVEAEPGHHEVVVATAVGRADQILDLLGRDGAVLRTEGDRHGRLTFRVGVRFALVRPAAPQRGALRCSPLSVPDG